jgi:methyltransferase (TIGR00027 family)
MKLQQPVPVLRMLDEAKAREFYLDFLGFSVDFEHRFGDGAPLYMQITRSGCTIHLSEHYGDAVPGGALRIQVDDVDALNKELLDKHYKYARPGVSDTPWRTREMTIKDPFGNRLVFSQPVETPSFDVGDLRGAMTPVGLTAQWVAANRALETESANPLYRDEHARDLAGPAGFAMMAATRSVLGLSDATKPDPYLTTRTKFLDDAILAAMKEGGLTQVVILAAGMDARAFRLGWPAGLTLYEVDRDDVFDHKEAVLARRNAEPLCHRRIVRADLALPWTKALLDAGFDSSRPAAFLTEGLLMYLDEPSVARLFDAIRTLAAAGSWIGLDLVNTNMLTSPYTAAYMKKLAEAGCPWNFSVDDPLELLARYGWTATVRSPGDPDVSYGRWPFPPMPRGLPGIPRTFFVAAVRTNEA